MSIRSGQVFMESPDGSEKMWVPAGEVLHYKQKGAKIADIRLRSPAGQERMVNGASAARLMDSTGAREVQPGEEQPDIGLGGAIGNIARQTAAASPGMAMQLAPMMIPGAGLGPAAARLGLAFGAGAGGDAASRLIMGQQQEPMTSAVTGLANAAWQAPFEGAAALLNPLATRFAKASLGRSLPELPQQLLESTPKPAPRVKPTGAPIQYAQPGAAQRAARVSQANGVTNINVTAPRKQPSDEGVVSTAGMAEDQKFIDRKVALAQRAINGTVGQSYDFPIAPLERTIQEFGQRAKKYNVLSTAGEKGAEDAAAVLHEKLRALEKTKQIPGARGGTTPQRLGRITAADVNGINQYSEDAAKKLLKFRTENKIADPSQEELMHNQIVKLTNEMLNTIPVVKAANLAASKRINLKSAKFEALTRAEAKPTSPLEAILGLGTTPEGFSRTAAKLYNIPPEALYTPPRQLGVAATTWFGRQK